MHNIFYSLFISVPVLFLVSLPYANLLAKETNIINIEMIIFANATNKEQETITELFPPHVGELNKLHITDHLDLNKPVKALAKDYNKLKNNHNYAIVLQATKQYSISPNRKNYKFFIKTDNVAATLNIAPNPIRNNYFSVTLDSIYLNYRLTKHIKIKNKEIYYFDHPKFGVLITVF